VEYFGIWDLGFGEMSCRENKGEGDYFFFVICNIVFCIRFMEEVRSLRLVGAMGGVRCFAKVGSDW
jgi:hypothetical protein